MMRGIVQTLTLLTLCAAFIFVACTSQTTDEGTIEPMVTEIETAPSLMPVSYEPLPSFPPVVIEEELVEEEAEKGIPDEDVDLIALVTMAEAEGECEDGKRLVIDTILNRVDSEHFPDTVYDVIYQRNQFSSMWSVARLEKIFANW